MNTAARKVAAILVGIAVIAGPFASVVPMVSADEVTADTVDTSVSTPYVTPDNFKISGIVFNDLDTNDHYNDNEPLLEGWKVVVHQGDENGPVVGHDTTDAGGNFFIDGLSTGDYFVEEITQDGWDQTTSDMHVSLNSYNSDVTVNFANVQLNQDGNGDGGNGGSGGTTPPPPPTTITVDASNVVCTDATQLPTWGKGGFGPITATTAKDWVAAHPSCSLSAGWNFDYAYQYTPYGGDTTIGHDSDFTAFGPTAATGSTTVSFAPASTTAVQVREQLQDGYLPFTFTADPTNNTTPSAQMYCNTDVLNYDNADFITSPVLGSTYYCVAFNALKPVAIDTGSTGGGNGGGSPVAPTVTTGGGGGVVSGPLSIGFVNTNTGGGLVLGTSTEDTSGSTGCNTPLLSTFMRAGKNNDKGEVTKLQTFLNTELGMHMPVTGFFGSMTTTAVNNFQAKYQSDVLTPWAPFGLNGTPTGYVYKTTQHKINMLACGTLNLPSPQLP